MLANIRIVLVRPRGSGNIGSIARAMKNMGQTELAIVGKARTRSFWARAMAVHGREILENAKGYDTLRRRLPTVLLSLEQPADRGSIANTADRHANWLRISSRRRKPAKSP